VLSYEQQNTPQALEVKAEDKKSRTRLMARSSRPRSLESGRCYSGPRFVVSRWLIVAEDATDPDRYSDGAFAFEVRAADAA
jgi:hypothetical protein